MPLTVWVSQHDELALDELAHRYSRLSRHLCALAVVRAGLAALASEPERLLDLVADRRGARHARLREPGR